MNPIKFVGWVEGPRSIIHILNEVGMQGKKIYRHRWHYKHCVNGPGKYGIYEHCEGTLEQLVELSKCIPTFWFGCFTAIDEKGEQLPTCYQLCWFQNRTCFRGK